MTKDKVINVISSQIRELILPALEARQTGSSVYLKAVEMMADDIYLELLETSEERSYVRNVLTAIKGEVDNEINK